AGQDRQLARRERQPGRGGGGHGEGGVRRRRGRQPRGGREVVGGGHRGARAQAGEVAHPIEPGRQPRQRRGPDADAVEGEAVVGEGRIEADGGGGAQGLQGEREA